MFSPTQKAIKELEKEFLHSGSPQLATMAPWVKPGLEILAYVLKCSAAIEKIKKPKGMKEIHPFIELQYEGMDPNVVIGMDVCSFAIQAVEVAVVKQRYLGASAPGNADTVASPTSVPCSEPVDQADGSSGVAPQTQKREPFAKAAVSRA